VSSPAATIYLTVWVSDQVACHFGKTEGAEERYSKHAGTTMAPPIGGKERMETFLPLKAALVEVTGEGWRQSSMDVAVAGLGWIGVALAGTATLRVWAPPGVAVTTRHSLIPDMAKELERPGFGLAAPAAAVGGRKGSSRSKGDKKNKSKR